MYEWWKRFISVQAGFFALIGVALLVGAIRSGSSGQLGFVVVWIIGVVLVLYRFSQRIGSALTLRNGLLTWTAPRGHAVTKPLAQLRTVHPWPGGGSVSVLTFSDGTKLQVWVRKGFREFIAVLQQQQPDLTDVNLGTYSRLSERAPWGDTGYRRTHDPRTTPIT